MTITSQDLPGILERHRKWLRSEDGGSRANLFRDDLSGANLSGAVHGWAKIAFAGHGECGRMLTAIRLKEGDEPRLFCGCFDGTSTELVEYIQKGKAEYRATRTKAMQCVLELLDMKNGEA